jgi:hypothetical protein
LSQILQEYKNIAGQHIASEDVDEIQYCPLSSSDKEYQRRRLDVGCMDYRGELTVSVNTTRLVNHISNASNKFLCTSLNVCRICFTSLRKFTSGALKSMMYWHENVSKFTLQMAGFSCMQCHLVSNSGIKSNQRYK